MGTRAKAGTSLEALVKLGVPLLKEAERRCPRTGPGAKPIIPDWFIGVLIMVAVLKRKKSKSAQFRFVTDPVHQRQIRDITGEKQLPSRSTFFSRYRRCHQLFTKAIQLQGERAIAEKIIDASQVAVDKSLVSCARSTLAQARKEAGEDSPGRGSRSRVGLLRTPRLGLRLQLRSGGLLQAEKHGVSAAGFGGNRERRGGANVRGKNR